MYDFLKPKEKRSFRRGFSSSRQSRYLEISLEKRKNRSVEMHLRKVIYILSLACCFGPSFLFMKVGGKEVPPLTLVALRLLLGALPLLLLLKFKKGSFWVYRRHTKHFLTAAIFSCFFPFFLITWSEKTIESSLAGLINGSTPIFTVFFAHFFLPNDRLSKQKVLGVFFGLIGLGIIFIPTLKREGLHIQGMVMVMIASISYAIGMIYSKKYLTNLPFLVTPIWKLIIGALIALCFALYFESPRSILVPSFQAIASIFALAFLGTALAFIFYYRILQIGTASDLSFVTLLTPLIAILLGLLFLGEQLRLNAYLGGALILLGLGILMGLISLKKIKKLLSNIGIRKRTTVGLADKENTDD